MARYNSGPVCLFPQHPRELDWICLHANAIHLIRSRSRHIPFHVHFSSAGCASLCPLVAVLLSFLLCFIFLCIFPRQPLCTKLLDQLSNWHCKYAKMENPWPHLIVLYCSARTRASPLPIPPQRAIRHGLH